MLYNVHMKRKKDKKIFGDFFEKMKDRLMRGRKDYYEEDETSTKMRIWKTTNTKIRQDDEYIEEEDVYEEEETTNTKIRQDDEPY